MTLDNETDRQVLLEIISVASVKGSAVFAVADLVSRLQMAEINSSSKSDISSADEDGSNAG